MCLDLQPIARAPALRIARARPLCHHALETLLLGRGEERLAVVEDTRQLHRRHPPVEQLLQQLPALRQRTVEDRLAVELEHVEELVHDRRPGLPLLHGGEARAAVLVECAHLTVDDAVGGLDRAGERLGDLGKAAGEVVPVAREEPRLAAAHVAECAIAVPLHLEEPVVPGGERVCQSREHRPVVVPRTRVAVLALAHEEPVLFLAVEVRGDQRPRALEPLAVEAYGETAVLLLLDQVVRAAVPDLDRTGAVPTLRDLTLETAVVERMVFDMHRERADARLERHALRHGPGREHAVALEAEVVVEATCVVPLDDERRRPFLSGCAGERLLRLLRVAFSPVLVQAHDAVLARERRARFVRSTDSRSACIKSTTSPSGCAGSGSSCPSAFARMSSISSWR